MSGASFVLDEEGNAIPSPDLFASGRLLNNLELRLVGVTEREGKQVSTVFIVIPSRFDDEGRPYIWETMVQDDAGWSGQRRYVTLKEAVAGHKAIVLSVFGVSAPTTRWGKLVYKTEKGFEPLRRSVWERLLDPDDLGLPEDPTS